MIVAERTDRSDKRQLIHSLCQTRKKFGNLNAGDVGRNGAEGAAGLRVPRIHLARAAFEEDQDARLGFAFQLAARRCREPQGLRQMNTKKPERPDLNEIPSCEVLFASPKTTLLNNHGSPLMTTSIFNGSPKILAN